MAYPTDYIARKSVKEVALVSSIRCEGTGKLGYVPDEYKNITPLFRIRCNECDKEFKPNETGLLPVHKPSGMRFTFEIKYDDMCDIGRHSLKKGTRARYLGHKLVCVKHL